MLVNPNVRKVFANECKARVTGLNKLRFWVTLLFLASATTRSESVCPPTTAHLETCASTISTKSAFVGAPRAWYVLRVRRLFIRRC